MNASSDKHIDQLASSYGEEFTPDVERALRKVRGRIGAGQSSGRDPGARVRTLTRTSWLAVAATVALLVTAGYFLLPAGQVSVTNDGHAPLATSLPDGTTVLLQENAELSYDRDFNHTDRRVALSGQAYFEVAADRQRPFLVGNRQTELRVTGTAFNLRIDGDELEVEVSEGSVELVQESTRTPVTARECGLAKPGKRAVLMDAPHLNRHAWRTGKLKFDNTPVTNVLRTLENNFGRDISLAEPCDVSISANFTAKELMPILEDLVALGGTPGRIEETKNGAITLTGLCGQ